MEKTVKIGSLFDGSGGFPLAASLCGIEPIWASEIEPYPIAVTRSRFPKMKHLGDVSKVSGADIEPVDIVTFGSPCFPAGTLVLTNKGYRPVEELRCGDIVFTHKGNWKPISAIGYKQSHTVKLKGNHYGIITTPNHPFYSAEQGKQWNGNGYTRTLEKIGGWTAAAEMQGKRWAVPNFIHGIDIPHIEQTSAKQNTPPAIDQDLMYIIGRWLGDGWLRNGQRQNRPEGETWGQIFICANADKAGYLEERLHIVFDGVSAINRFSERTAEKFRVCNQPLCEWIAENFGSYAYGKRIPAWAYCMNTKMREALLHGYIDSDGYRYKENTWKATTVSKELAHGIRLLAETLDYSCTVHYADVGSTTVIEGRTVNQKPQYEVVMCKEKRTTAIKHGIHTWYKCRTVESYSESQTVYNITVDDDHSYIVEGFVVHNCQDMSIAGKRAGLKHEDNGDDETTRSGLFMEAVRIIKEMREATNGEYPTFAVWENVPGAFSSNKGEDFRTVLEELIKIVEPSAVMPAVPKNGWPYADSYCGDGWSLAYRAFDAQYWGVPQRRRRIYLVADFRGQRAGEILFEREGVRGDFATCKTEGQGAAGDAADRAGADDCEGEGNCLTPWDVQSRRVFSVDGPWPALYGGEGGGHGYDCIPYTLKIRSGCDGGGKGALIQVDKSATLATNNDQYLFQPVAYSFDSLASNSMKSKNPQSGCRCVEIAKTLDTTDPNPCKNQGGIAVVCVKCYDARGNGDGQTVSTLTGDHENRITDYSSIVVEKNPVYCLQGNGIDRADTAGCNGRGWKEDVGYTLNTIDRHAVAYQRQTYDKIIEGEIDTTLKACGGDCGGGSETIVCERKHIRYIVRRLTPTECARLQGFPDDWGHPDHKEDFTDEEYRFWLDVRNTHAAINGKPKKDYTKAQMLTWYNRLHTDSSEYKMWGNGIALPCALYCMQGIADAIRQR